MQVYRWRTLITTIYMMRWNIFGIIVKEGDRDRIPNKVGEIHWYRGSYIVRKRNTLRKSGEIKESHKEEHIRDLH